MVTVKVGGTVAPSLGVTKRTLGPLLTALEFAVVVAPTVTVMVSW